MKNYFFVLLSILLLSCNQKQANAQTEAFQSLPTIESVVTDFEDVLTPKEEQLLSQIITDFEQKTTNEIAVVTVKSIEPYTDIFTYSLDLANKIGVGKKEKSNGILIVVSQELRQIQIQNGDGITPILSDEKTKEILDQFIIPQFKNGDYYRGIHDGIQEIIKILEQ